MKVAGFETSESVCKRHKESPAVASTKYPIHHHK